MRRFKISPDASAYNELKQVAASTIYPSITTRHTRL